MAARVAPPTVAPPRGRTGLPTAALVVTAALLTTRPLQDPDVFWHLTNGRQILDQHTLVPTDGRAFTVPPAAHVNPSWLWDGATALLERAAGLDAVLLLPALLAAAAFAVGVRLASPDARPFAALAGLLAVPAVALRAHPRPDAATFLCVAALAALLVGPATRTRAGSIAALTAVWVQLHASFLLAPLLLVPAALGSRAGAGRGVVRLAAAGLAGVAVGVLVHPAGPLPLLRTVLGQTDRSGGVVILEWQPPSGLTFELSAGAALVGLAALVITRARRDRPWGLVVLAVVLLVAAASSNRFVALAAFTSWLALSRALPSPPRALPAWAAPAALLVLLAGHLHDPMFLPGLAVPDSERPSGPLAALDAATPPGRRGRVLNWFDLGAVLAWEHGGGWQIALGPRAELAYPPEVQRAVTDAFSGGAAWASFDQAYSPDAVLLPRAAPLCGELSAAEGWGAAAWDTRWVTFVRGAPDSPAASALDPCADPVAQLHACQADPARAAVEAAAALAARTSDAGTARLAGMLALGCGHDASAGARWLDEAVARDPRDPEARLARLLAARATGREEGADALWLRWFHPELLAGP